MQMIQKVLDDAENRSMRDSIVQEWLDKLQDLCYEMEDVLDEWNTIVNKLKLEQPENNSSSNQISSSSASSSNFTCLPFNFFKQLGWRRDLASRIKIINQNVDSVFNQMDRFEFISSKIRSVAPDALTMNNFEIDRPTTSLVNKSLIHGRDAEKDVVLSMLLGENNEPWDDIVVISIVGLGGLGKTTLAQLVYNDESVIKDFEKRIWVCVSNPFDEVKVAKGILEGLGVDHRGKDELQTLHQSVQSSFSKHKFLLVLDDVWNEEREKWERLKACLDTGVQGSRVLVTTRIDEVAIIMNTSKVNMVRPRLISDSDCWLLMSRIAFQGKGKDDVCKFEKIGKEIARKCKGLPLAAKTLGGLLILKDTIEEWKEVLNSEIWKLNKVEIELFPHLFLSYRELPSALKRCFIFFSIFPKDYEIKVGQLITLWIANGYINQTKEIYDLKRVGQEYFNYLLSRSFFQVRSVFQVRGRTSKVSMHDIMHDFALHLSRNNFLTITNNDSNPEPTPLELHKSKKTHHLFINGEIPFPVCDVGTLRTCLATRVPRAVTLDMLTHLKLVRALSLIRCYLNEIPQEIGKFILRTLDLSYNHLVKELPETVGDLYNLKYLFLEGLALKKLSQSIGKLINLKILAVDPEKWKLLAHESLGKLLNLQTLSRVHVKAGSRGLGFLKYLNKLHEDLEIVFESNYSDEVDANEAKLKCKKHIKKLTFNFKGKDVAKLVVDALEPSTEIEVVEIVNFKGTQLPSWITSLPEMTELKVSSAKNIVSLPSLGKLKYLEKLKRLVADKVELPSNLEFPGEEVVEGTIETVLPPFPNLQYLKIQHTGPILPSWISCLNYLTELHLDGAEVQSLPPLGKLPFLESLKIKGLSSLKFIGHEFLGIDIEKNVNTSRAATTKVEGMEKDNNQKNIIGTSITSFPKLKKLYIYNCSELEVWEDIEAEEEEDVDDDDAITLMPFLDSLIIQDCPKLELLPHRLLWRASSLRKVKIDGCELASNLKFTGEEVETLQSPFPNLKKLSILNYMGPRVPSWLSCLNCLRDLYLYDAPEVQSLPPLGKLPFLESLKIEEFSALKSIGREFLGIHIEKNVNNSIAATSAPVSSSSSTKIEGMEEDDNQKNIIPTSITSFPKLEILSIWNCSELGVRKFLGIDIEKKVNTSIAAAAAGPVSTKIEEREEDNNQKNIINTSVTSFPKLKILTIYGCSKLEVWEDIKAEEDVDAITLMPNLNHLSIKYCAKLEVLPHSLLRRASSLKQLYISWCGIKVREKIVEDVQLLLRLQNVVVDDENLIPQERNRR